MALNGEQATLLIELCVSLERSERNAQELGLRETATLIRSARTTVSERVFRHRDEDELMSRID